MSWSYYLVGKVNSISEDPRLFRDAISLSCCTYSRRGARLEVITSHSCSFLVLLVDGRTDSGTFNQNLFMSIYSHIVDKVLSSITCIMYIQYFADQYKILAKFPKDVRGNTLDAIMQYAFMDIEPKLEDDPIVYALFEGMRFSIDKSVRTAKVAIENGKKGGAPRGNQNAVKSFENVLKQPKSTQNNQEQRTTNNEQRTKKEINNTQTAVGAKKKINLYSEEFENFWNIYPKKKGKVKAYEVWNKRINSGVDADYIIQKASDYAREIRLKKVEDQFIKRPQGWLNEGRYDDEYFTGRKKQEVKIEETKKLSEEERKKISLNLQKFRNSLYKKTAFV